jgi:hypothetical protein
VADTVRVPSMSGVSTYILGGDAQRACDRRITADGIRSGAKEKRGGMERWIKGKKAYHSNSQLCASRIALPFVQIPSATLRLRHHVYQGRVVWLRLFPIAGALRRAQSRQRWKGSGSAHAYLTSGSYRASQRPRREPRLTNRGFRYQR